MDKQRKQFLISLSLFLALAVIFTNPVFADESQTSMDTSTSSASASMPIKYDLAYPGLLPDNPLYKLKVLRDKIEEAMISDPQKKMDFYLLEADKGILASAILVDKKEINLAKQTALKAENNMTLITYMFGQLPSKPSSTEFSKLEKASLKHQEVLTALSKRVSAADAKTFQSVVNFSKTNLKSIEDFKNSHTQ